MSASLISRVLVFFKSQAIRWQWVHFDSEGPIEDNQNGNEIWIDSVFTFIGLQFFACPFG